MPKKERLIESIPATMQEVLVRSFFANDPKLRDPEKEKKQIKAESYNLKIKQESSDK